jgi:K+-sensing histidine kinase KdpD
MPRSIVLISNLAIVILLGYLDFVTGTEFAFIIFYFLPIVIVAWFLGFWEGIIFSFFCATAWSLADYLGGHDYSSQIVFEWKAFTRLITFLMISILIFKLKKNMAISAKEELAEQKSKMIIETSQRITGMIMENISQHNSKIMQWIITRKANDKSVPSEIENAQKNISANLSALSEVSFDHNDNNYDLDAYMEALEKKLAALKEKIGQ